MAGWLAGWLAGWMDGWMDGWVDICIHVCMHDLLMYIYIYIYTRNGVFVKQIMKTCFEVLYAFMQFTANQTVWLTMNLVTSITNNGVQQA